MKRRICLAWFGDPDGFHRGDRSKPQSRTTLGSSSLQPEGDRSCLPQDKERFSELRRWIRRR